MMFLLTVTLLVLHLSSEGHGQNVSSKYFCADMEPQTHIDITQLTGMWFGIELINHMEERYNLKYTLSCPIIHISHDRESLTTVVTPLHRDYNYGYNYGEGYAYGPSNNEYNTRTPNQYETQYDGNVRYNNNPNNRYDRNYENQQYRQTNQETTLSPREIRKKLRQQFEYDQRTTYTNYQQKKRLTYGYELPMPYWETKYLRLFWDENGESIEFHMRYNLTYPGFWISSGPENGGASLDSRYRHFAGTIQVIKAVGSHLVLTFCHRLPKNELYTIILSREINLPYDDIHAVRSQLHRKHLSIRSIKNLCSHANLNKLSVSLLLSEFILFFNSIIYFF